MTRRILKNARVGMAGTAFLAVFGGLLSLGAVALQSTPASAIVATGQAYFPITPTRIYDTRAATNVGGGTTLGPNGIAVVTIPNTAPAGSTAVVLNVTATNGSQLSYFTVFPTGSTTAIQTGGANANYSNLNFSPGENQPNLVTVPIGTGPSVSIYNHSGTADVVVDLEGYFATPATSAGQFFPLTPTRITDTRPGSGQVNAGSTIGPAGVLAVQIDGAGGVPNPGTNEVSAVELNITVTNTTADSFLTVWPQGSSRPTASNLNWSTGNTVANRVIVPIQQVINGGINIYNFLGNTDVVVDVVGWFSNASYGSANGNYFNAVQPARLSDTRTGSGSQNAGVPLTGNTSELVQVSAHGGVPASTAGAPITAAVLNITEADATQSSFLTVYPPAGTPPLASDLNFVPNDVIANGDMVSLSTTGTFGQVQIYNFSGTTDVVVDVFGYFVPVTPVGP